MVHIVIVHGSRLIAHQSSVASSERPARIPTSDFIVEQDLQMVVQRGTHIQGP
jgi:hypothetical protein